MPTYFDSVIRLLDGVGFVDVLLPFALLFTVCFAFLEKTRVLGRRRLNGVVSFVLALFVVTAVNLLGAVNVIVQYTGLLGVVVVSFAVLLGLFGVRHLPQSRMWNSLFFVIFMLMAVFVFRQFELVENDSILITIFVLSFFIFFIIQFWFKEEPVQQVLSPTTQHARASPQGAVSGREAARRAAPEASSHPEVISDFGKPEEGVIE